MESKAGFFCVALMFHFMGGPRRCLGDKFSLLEQRTLLLKFLVENSTYPKPSQTLLKYHEKD